jgi:OOP family OmpA-OmpF porin
MKERMQHKILAAFAAAALVPALALAEPTYYIGVDAGSSEQKFSVDGLGSAKEHKASYQVVGGVNLTPHYGIEGGYTSFGKTRQSAEGATLAVNPQAFYVAATGTLPLSGQFALFGKAGVSYGQAKLSVSVDGPFGTGESASDTFHKTSAMFGVGASYTFPSRVAVVAEYQNFGKIADEDGVSLKASTLSLGLRYQF